MSARREPGVRWRVLADAGQDERLLHELGFLRADPFGEGLLVVDGHVADLRVSRRCSEHLVSTRLMSFIKMKVTTADQKMTNRAARNCSQSWWPEPVYNRPDTEKGTQVPCAASYADCDVLTTCPAASR